MSLELRNVTYRVGADISYRRHQPRARGRFVQHPPRPDARRQDDADADHGRTRAPTSGEVFFRGKSVRGVPVQKRNVAMVYQQFINYPNFTVYENIASPLRVAGIPAGRDQGQGRQDRRTPPADADAEPASLRAFRRPAAADGDRPRPGQGLRPDPPRRAARQSRLQASRGTARRAAQLLRRRQRIVVYATTEPTEALPLRRQHRDAAEGRITQFGPTADTYRRPSDLVTAQVFSDPPINTASVRKRGGEILIGDSDPSAGRKGRRGDRRWRLHDRHPAASHQPCGARRRAPPWKAASSWPS